MRQTLRRAALACFLFSVGGDGVVGAAAALPPNGGFEEGWQGWSPLWTRDPGSGSAEIDEGVAKEGERALRVELQGPRDWCVNTRDPVAVGEEDLVRLNGWARVEGEGTVTLAMTTLDAAGAVVEWVVGGQGVSGPSDWVRLEVRLVVPQGVAAVRPRWVGEGRGRIWLDDTTLEVQGNLASVRAALPERVAISNAFLTLELRSADGIFDVTDRRTGHIWRQQPMEPGMVVLSVRRGRGLELVMLDARTGLRLTNQWRLEPDSPEVSVLLGSFGPFSGTLDYPHPFDSEPDQSLIVPLNEGVAYPVDDRDIEPTRLIAYGGHGISMAFWGVTEGDQGYMAILETPDDAAIRLRRRGMRMNVAPEWHPQRGQWGYTRRLRYVFFDQGGYVAMAKRYRAQVRREGRLRTLAQKREENPFVDRLLGAVNVWCWDADAVGLVREMQSAGIQRILWSNRQSPENLRVLNDLEVLTSRYDIYQDVMDPAKFPQLQGVHRDWVTEAWPDDLTTDARGRWLHGWEVRARDGSLIPCGVVCDLRAPEVAAKRIREELATHPYRCRFIDTTTASPWRECYDPRHPMTRTESREAKMRLLALVSTEQGLVTGCETGHDAAVPWVHYFEGMLSLGSYRVPDAGRDLQRIWTDVPERVAKFQLGHRYRLPLWELVYHDCVVAQWYWGDYSNKLPALWDQRDLFNALYGTPPMFMFDRQLWRQEQARFVRSYQNTAPIARATALAEMIDHRFLAEDRSVQQTTFQNGVRVTVNFGDAACRLADGFELGPLGMRAEGL